jgi:hypothetical protein
MIPLKIHDSMRRVNDDRDRGLFLADLPFEQGGYKELFENTSDIDTLTKQPGFTSSAEDIVSATCLLMENEKSHIVAKNRSLFEDVRSVNVGGFQDFLFPVIRSSFPVNPILDWVSVQPMSRRHGQIFYMNYVVAQTKGNYAAGSKFFDALTGYRGGSHYSDDCLSIEKKLFWYNTIVRPGWSYADSAELPEDQRGLPMRAVSMIPGFDTGVESTMEFLIVRDYLRTVGSDKDPVRELCRLDLWMQELTGRSLLTCVELTNQKSRKGKETRGKDVDERVKLWEKLYKVSLSAHQKAQRELLRKYGAEIFGDLLPKLEKQLPKDGQTFMEI